MEFEKELGQGFSFKITQVIGLTNGDAVSTEHRPFKQMIERFNRTYKASYRHTNGFDNIYGANYDPALRAAYYNFLRLKNTINTKPLTKSRCCRIPTTCRANVIKFTDHPVPAEKGYCTLFLLSGKDGYGRCLKILKPSISAIFKVHMYLFSRLSFFIDYLTLPFIFSCILSGKFVVFMWTNA